MLESGQTISAFKDISVKLNEDCESWKHYIGKK